MTWAAKRQLTVLFFLALIIGGIGFLYYAPQIFKSPTCSDMKQNGEENGVDCGGVCVRFCANQITDPTVLWVRSFPVTGNIYNAVAYIENTNVGATRSIPYEFRLYDENGLLVTRLSGTALIPPSGRYAIIETGINSGTAKIARTTIDIDFEKATWERISEEVSNLRIATSNLALTNTGTAPKLTATITNPDTIRTLRGTSIVAIVYDANDNAMNASRTIVQSLSPNQNTPIFFTWPQPFQSPPVRYELLPIIDVFDVSK